MMQLSNTFNCTVDLNKVDHGDFSFIHQICSTNSSFIIRNVRGISASELPRTSSGKLVLLAMSAPAKSEYYKTIYSTSKYPTEHDFLDMLTQIEQHGYSLEDEDYNEGILSIAAPIFQNENIAAAMSMTNTTSFIRHNEKKLSVSLMSVCAIISNELSGQPIANE